MHLTFKRVASIFVSFMLISLASAQNRRYLTGTLIAEYTVPTPGSGPMGIVTGPDGNLWFTEYDGNKIGRITPEGVITEFPVPTGDSFPSGIAAGPDGAIWFTESARVRVGRVTTDGRLRDRFLPPHLGSVPWGLAFATDGSLWITEFSLRANAVERMTRDRTFRQFPINSNPRALPLQIITGPNGRMYFTEWGSAHVGEVDASGRIVERFVDHAPTALANGPDGRVWVCVSYYLDGKIAAVDAQLNVTDYRLPNPASDPEGITTGPDGNLWITEYESSAILQMSPSGQVLGEFPLPDFYSGPEGITVGPDGNIWFVEFSGNRIGVMAP